ncbi:hypothetical protein ACA910_002098 [Epithemia clementina (nom. ined.)]
MIKLVYRSILMIFFLCRPSWGDRSLTLDELVNEGESTVRQLRTKSTQYPYKKHAKHMSRSGHDAINPTGPTKYTKQTMKSRANAPIKATKQIKKGYSTPIVLKDPRKYVGDCSKKNDTNGGNDQSSNIQVDFSTASPSNPVFLDSISEDPDAEIQVTVPPGAQVFVVKGPGSLVDGGSTCPPPPGGGGDAVAVDATSIVTVPLEGIDLVIYVCNLGVVVGRCVHVTSSSPNLVAFNFGGASSSNFVSGSFTLPPSGGWASFGSCEGCNFYFAGGGFLYSGGGGGFTPYPRGLPSPGDACPPQSSQRIPSDGTFGQLFIVEGSTVIYACNGGVIVGYCVIEVEVEPGATMRPTASPSNARSLQPSVSLTVAVPTFNCDFCDDGDLCTTDVCDPTTGQCTNQPLACGENEACDSFTGQCEEAETVVPCVAVIDEWDNRDYTSSWESFRNLFPRRPFCLLVPNLAIGRLPDGFFNDTYNNLDGIDRTIVRSVERDDGGVLSSDWFDICQLDLISPNSVPFIGLFIDTSGSMNLNTVRTSRDLFLENVAAAGFNISEVFNGAEQWLDPFLTTLIP